MSTISSKKQVEEQIYNKRKSVRYDIRDLTVEQIVRKYQDSIDESWDSDIENIRSKSYNLIYIPEYQRDFTWDENRQSRLIESIILGLPIPFIFVAENSSSAWEIVDGSQRIRTLHTFINNKLILKNLDSLNTLNGYKFENLEDSRQGKLLNTALRLIVLSEETTEDVKKDMFERINKGSDLLKPMESRKGIYKGLFNDFIYSYAQKSTYTDLVIIDKWLEKRQEREELLLRFFALSENKKYLNGIEDTGVAKYLDSYLNKKNKELDHYLTENYKIIGSKNAEYLKEINSFELKINMVLDFVKTIFPYGFRVSHNPQTKRSVFEAISLGVYRFLEVNPNIDKARFDKEKISQELRSDAFRKLIAGSQLHKKQKLNGRVMFIFNLLESLK